MKVLRNRILLKSIAVFFVLEIASSTVLPAVSYALTAGPTAPEATSFEPVDTTDMVNTITGDLAYNVPLLEVPGPAGSYPISLSYHAGIDPNVEASWVGLGWTLNPGAINRMTNGLPDDFRGSKSNNRIYWGGGSTDITTVGVSIGIANVATVSGGLTFANDTYRGRGVGGYLGVGLGIGGQNSPLSVNATVGLSPYGGTTIGIGLGIGGGIAEGVGVSANIGMTVNSEGSVAAGLSGGISVSKGNPNGKDYASLGGSVLGASIGTSGEKGNLSAGGFSGSANNSKAGKISTSVNDMQLDIPIWYGVNIRLGRTHIRYWMDERETYENYGSLFFPKSNPGDMSLHLYDSYHLQNEQSVAEEKQAIKYMNGSFADYDSYSVNAQGLGGNFRPYHYIASLFSQDILNNDNPEVLGYYIPQHARGVQYRFENDFSNRVLNSPPNIEVDKIYEGTSGSTTSPSGREPAMADWEDDLNNTYQPSTKVPLFFPYGNPITGIEGYEGDTQAKRRLPFVPGSKHIEYFTNDKILSGVAKNEGYIECNASGFVRTSTTNDGQVGGFKVTNGSGVTYHFSLPAYSYDEYNYQQTKDSQGVLSFTMSNQKGKYAYTWYLTGITGPDYIDRGPDGANGDGFLNEFDWGYWVSFEYGKWTDRYEWRNPLEGFNKDIDQKLESFSRGKKEVYYLNAIRTASHTAFFVKEIRPDAKSSTSNHKNDAGGEYFWVEGGSSIKENTSYYQEREDPDIINDYYITDYIYPVSSLRLSKIVLIPNINLHDSLTLESLYSSENYSAFSKTYDSKYGELQNLNKIQMGENILDVFDYESNPFLETISVRNIGFDHSYDLCPGTSNSFDSLNEIYSFPLRNDIVAKKLGKLTLNSISFGGKEGEASIVPPMKFYYDTPSRKIWFGTITASDDGTKIVNALVRSNHYDGVLENGDLVVFSVLNTSYHGYLTNVASSVNGTMLTLKVISTNVPENGEIINELKTTKNPPYNKDMVDVWGCYKIDYMEESTENLKNYPTDLSSKHIDVWSLREIITNLGTKISIHYESDSFSENILENLNIKLEDANDPLNDDYVVANLPESSQINFTELYSVGNVVALSADFFISTGGMYCPNRGTIKVLEDKKMVIDTWSSGAYVWGDYPIDIGWNSYNTFRFGVLFIKTSKSSLGGGLRISSVGVTNLQGDERRTNYSYEFNGVSSGVTSYEPVPNYINSSGSKEYKANAAKKLLTIVSLARELPSPAVYYKNVRVEEEIVRNTGVINKIPGYTDFEFVTFDAGMVGLSNDGSDSKPSVDNYKGQLYQRIDTKKVSIKNFTQRLGNLKRITAYNEQGQKISETINHYLDDEQSNKSFNSNKAEYPTLMEQYKSQGVIQETFNHARWVKISDALKVMQGLISKKETYPSIQTGSTNINYKTGIKTETKNLAFDFYSGAVVKTLETDANGNHFVTEITPAYKVYPSMGLKTDYGGSMLDNKHMIEQEAKRFVYKVSDASATTIDGIISGSVNTWSNQVAVNGIGTQARVWRKLGTHVFVGNPDEMSGIHPLPDGNLPQFNAWNKGQVDNSGLWQKINEMTLYDVYSHGLEAHDLNEQYVATKMSRDETIIQATVANARYNEFAFSGAEDNLENNDLGGGVTSEGELTNEVPHTGNYGIRAAAGKKAFAFTATVHDKAKFLVSVWSDRHDGVIKYRVNNGLVMNAVMEPFKYGGSGLKCLSGIIPEQPAGTQLEIWCEGNKIWNYFDDFRVHPYDAVMTSYVYNNWGELSHILDSNNLFTYYEYDAMGRLVRTTRETFSFGAVKTSEVKYNYSTR